MLRITKNDCAELPDHVSPELARLVRSMLVRDPTARPSVAALLEEARRAGAAPAGGGRC